MFVHLLQALVIAVLFLFPFAYNVNDFSANFNSVNTCATVDSALVKYYSQTGSLPETLDAETIKKMGLDDKSVEGLTYKKLEDRKFVLSYEDSKSDVKESIHSNTLLPLSTVVNFGEEKPEYLFFEIDKVPHQVLEAKIDFPKGGFIVIREGDKVEVPKNSKYEVHHKADRGYKEGVVSHTKGLVQSDIFVTATAAEMIKYKLSVQDSNTQNVLIDVNDKASNKKFILKQGESALVGPGTIFNLKSITPISGYTSGSVFPSSGQVYKDTNIEVKNGEFKMYTVSVADTAHQTITVIIKGSDGKTYTITNGQTIKVLHGSTFSASIKADKSYSSGTLNITSGSVTKDVVISATDAKKDEVVPLNGYILFENLCMKETHSPYVVKSEFPYVWIKIPSNVDKIFVDAEISGESPSDSYGECCIFAKSQNKLWFDTRILDGWGVMSSYTVVKVTPGEIYKIAYQATKETDRYQNLITFCDYFCIKTTNSQHYIDDTF